jgi:hypothetical protein
MAAWEERNPRQDRKLKRKTPSRKMKVSVDIDLLRRIRSNHPKCTH